MFAVRVRDRSGNPSRASAGRLQRIARPSHRGNALIVLINLFIIPFMFEYLQVVDSLTLLFNYNETISLHFSACAFRLRFA